MTWSQSIRDAIRSVWLRGPLGTLCLLNAAYLILAVGVALSAYALVTQGRGKLPIAMLFVMLGASLQITWVLRAWRWESIGGQDTCIMCGYAVRGLETDACPECGYVCPPERRRAILRRLKVVNDRRPD